MFPQLCGRTCVDDKQHVLDASSTLLLDQCEFTFWGGAMELKFFLFYGILFFIFCTMFKGYFPFTYYKILAIFICCPVHPCSLLHPVVYTSHSCAPILLLPSSVTTNFLTIICESATFAIFTSLLDF